MRIQNIILREKIIIYSVKLPFEQVYTPPPPSKCLGAHFYAWFSSSFCRPFVISKSWKDMQLLKSCKLLRSCEPTITPRVAFRYPSSTPSLVFRHQSLSGTILALQPSLSSITLTLQPSLSGTFRHDMPWFPTPF